MTPQSSSRPNSLCPIHVSSLKSQRARASSPPSERLLGVTRPSPQPWAATATRCGASHVPQALASRRPLRFASKKPFKNMPSCPSRRRYKPPPPAQLNRVAKLPVLVGSVAWKRSLGRRRARHAGG